MLLAEEGLAGVNIRTVATKVGMTDAGVNHHFGSRQLLLRELLRHGGRRLRSAIDEALAEWLRGDASLETLVGALGDVYARGFAELAASLHAAGWRDRGSGLLSPVVRELHSRRKSRHASVEETQLAVAALHQALATEPLYGRLFRRSAGITGAAAQDRKRQYAWWAQQLKTTLDLEEETPLNRPSMT